jgi:hypothetical protein
MEVTLRPAASHIEVIGTVRLAPTSSERDTISLVLSSWVPTLAVTASDSSAIRVSSVTSDGASGDRRWKIALSHPLMAGRPITLAFKYASDSLRAAQFRVAPDGSVAGSGGEIWYPRLAFDSLATGVLRFHVPPGETVVSNGSLDRAASDPGRGVFEFHTSSGVRFGFASARYVRYDRDGKSPITLYLLKQRLDADSMLQRLSVVRAALEGQFGMMPVTHYAVAEVEFGGSTGGTSEFGFFLADRSYVREGLPTPFIGHELGHAWWGTRVSTKPGPGRTFLTEGIASFGMLRALEAVEGSNAAARMRHSAYPGYETSNSPAEYFALAAAGIEQAIGTFVPATQYDILAMHRMANTRGWFLLDMLSREIGRHRFEAILHAVTAKYSGGAISFEEFRREVETRAGRKISWFFDDWFDRTGAPTYTLHWTRISGGVSGTIAQGAPAFRATVPIEVRGSAGERVLMNVWVGDTASQFSVHVPFAARDVVLDPEYRVLRWTPAVRTASLARAGLTRADFERRFGSTDRAIALYRAALDSGPPEADTSAITFSLEYGLGVASLAQRDSAAAFVALQRAVSRLHRDSLAVPGALLLLARLAHARGDDDVATRAALAATAADAALGRKVGIEETLKMLPWFHKPP